jgi:hypothetical protein
MQQRRMRRKVVEGTHPAMYIRCASLELGYSLRPIGRSKCQCWQEFGLDAYKPSNKLPPTAHIQRRSCMDACRQGDNTNIKATNADIATLAVMSPASPPRPLFEPCHWNAWRKSSKAVITLSREDDVCAGEVEVVATTFNLPSLKESQYSGTF